MIAVRALLLVAVLITAPLAVSGLWAQSALNDSEGFAEQMRDRYVADGIYREFGDTVLTATEEQIYDFFSVSGPGEGFLPDTAVTFATNSIQQRLTSGAFIKAWADWHRQLHRDLAAIARGGTGSIVAVDGDILTVDASDLAEALITGPLGTLAAGVVGEQDLTQQIDAGYDVESDLQSLGDLAGNRWWFSLAAIGALAALVLLWRPRMVAAASGLFAAAVGCLALGLWRTLADPRPSGMGDTLQGTAISEAFSAGWSSWMFAVAAVAAVAGAGLLAHQRRRTRVPAPAPTPASDAVPAPEDSA